MEQPAVDWSAALPAHGIAGLEVREDLEAGARCEPACRKLVCVGGH
ncbi:hypothetical protein ACWDRB_48005 [Nonomuraea sp. NPDC003707]